MKWKLEDGEKKICDINSEEELEKCLIDIQRNLKEQNKIVILVSPTGEFMYIGISNKYTFLNYHNADDTPPYYSSVGEYEDSEEVIEYYLNDYLFEVSMRNCIIFGTMLLVVKRFFRTGILPDSIKWEED
ncbi:MAG TPA: Imm1 family immunity protein [Pseudobacteroides sp.]|nr:Imm1 family immunity protein [Pseudobacteroides sp.]